MYRVGRHCTYTYGTSLYACAVVVCAVLLKPSLEFRVMWTNERKNLRTKVESITVNRLSPKIQETWDMARVESRATVGERALHDERLQFSIVTALTASNTIRKRCKIAYISYLLDRLGHVMARNSRAMAWNRRCRRYLSKYLWYLQYTTLNNSPLDHSRCWVWKVQLKMSTMCNWILSELDCQYWAPKEIAH